MKPHTPDFQKFVRALGKHAAAITEELQRPMLKDPDVKARAAELRAAEVRHATFKPCEPALRGGPWCHDCDEASTRAMLDAIPPTRDHQSAESWTRGFAQRAAVYWIMKTVFVRLLEDRGLLAGRAFAPAVLDDATRHGLGASAFLSGLFGGLGRMGHWLAELFAMQPVEFTAPSDASCRALMDFWQETAPIFAGERCAGELAGDIFQQLESHTTKTFAHCQTPDFVRSFILDRTLTPAVERFGADDASTVDPTCGSGHFLVDLLLRHVPALEAQHPDWTRRQVVDKALDLILGVDLNPYVCVLARARLILAAGDLCGTRVLAELVEFRPHVFCFDALAPCMEAKNDGVYTLSPRAAAAGWRRRSA